MTNPATDPSAALLQTFFDPDQLKKDLTIDVRNISDSLANQTQLFVHYAMCAVRAKRQYDRWKSHLEVTEAQLDAEYRKTLASEGQKVTEPAIKAAIAGDSRWKAVHRTMIDAKQIHGLCDAAERSFEHRREMVKQIAQDQAREKEGGLRVMANQSAAERATALLERSRPAAPF